jgi:hypothetical protein
MERAQTVKKAALAPASPSGQDYSVASKAETMYQKAQSKQNKQNQSQTGKKLNIVG